MFETAARVCILHSSIQAIPNNSVSVTWLNFLNQVCLHWLRDVFMNRFSANLLKFKPWKNQLC